MSKLLLFILTITVINCYATDYDDLALKIKNQYDTIVALQNKIQGFSKFGRNANKPSKETDDFLEKRDITRNDAKNIFDKLSRLALTIIPQTPAPKFIKGMEFNIGKITIKEYDSNIKHTGFYENETVFKILIEALKSKDIIFAFYAYDQILEKSRYDFLLNNSTSIKEGLETLVKNILHYLPSLDKKQVGLCYYELTKIKNIENLKLYYYLNLTNEEIKRVKEKIKDGKILISKYFDNELLRAKYFNVEKTILEYNDAKDYKTKYRLLQVVSFVNNEQTFKALVLSLGSDLFEPVIKMPPKISFKKTIENNNNYSNKDSIGKTHSLEQTDEQYYMFRFEVFKEIVRSGSEFCNRDKLRYIEYGVNRGATREEQKAIFEEIVRCVKSNYNLEIKINPENKKNVFTNYAAPLHN
jgi:hypothetical protein